MKKQLFTTDQKTRIEESVASFEKSTGSELVIHIAKKSDSYFEACWISAAILGTTSIIISIFLLYFDLFPIEIGSIEILIGCFIFLIIGFLLPLSIPTIRLIFINNVTEQRRVDTNARDVFLHEEVFKTNSRTAVLIYISLLEHKVDVIGDTAIYSKTNDSDWDKIVETITKEIRKNTLFHGIVKAIDASKKLLIEKGFSGNGNQENELPNHLREN